MRVHVATWVTMAVLLAGCTARVTPPKIEIETGAPVTVEVGRRGGSGSGFCPPGQRKQGNC